MERILSEIAFNCYVIMQPAIHSLHTQTPRKALRQLEHTLDERRYHDLPQLPEKEPAPHPSSVTATSRLLSSDEPVEYDDLIRTILPLPDIEINLPPVRPSDRQYGLLRGAILKQLLQP